MKRSEVILNGQYLAKVSGKVATVRITGESPHGGWDAVNTATNRSVRIRSSRRLRRPAGAATQAAVASDNLLLRAGPGQFAEALNQATVEQMHQALALDALPDKQRRRIEAALANRTKAGTPDEADDIARTAAAVQKGNLAEGVQMPMPRKRSAKESE